MDLVFGDFFYYNIYRDIRTNHELGSPFTPCLVENIVEGNSCCMFDGRGKEGK